MPKRKPSTKVKAKGPPAKKRKIIKKKVVSKKKPTKKVSKKKEKTVPKKKTANQVSTKKAGSKKKTVSRKKTSKKVSKKKAANKTVLKKANTQSPVDRILSGAESYAVFGDYHVKLMQSNQGENNNKFYIIQVVQKDNTFFCWTRWGRLGENGQNKLAAAKSDADAITMFSKKFKDKTKNKWEDRHDFVKHKGKYQIVETTDEEGGDNEDAALGRLTEHQIKKGLAVLAQIRDLLENDAPKSAFTDLSSQFYSLIPTKSGRVRPPMIDNENIVGEKEALLEFWLRMGFEDMKVDTLSPIDGILDLPLPKTLKEAASRISNEWAIAAAVAKGSEMASRSAGNPKKKMDQELYASILLYTGDSIYSQLNAALRSGDRKAIQKYNRYLRLFLEAMSCMEQKKRTLWRGISVDLFNEYEVGKVITWWSVSSCTSEQSVARRFMSGCGGGCTLLTIECKTAMDVSALSHHSNEAESLLAPGTQLEILSRKRRCGIITEIHAREVGQAIS